MANKERVEKHEQLFDAGIRLMRRGEYKSAVTAGGARAAERHDRAISATAWSGHGAAARPASTRDSRGRGAPPEVSPGAEPERNIRSFRDGVE